MSYNQPPPGPPPGPPQGPYGQQPPQGGQGGYGYPQQPPPGQPPQGQFPGQQGQFPGQVPPPPPGGGGGSGKTIGIILAVVVVIAAIGVGGFFLLKDDGDDDKKGDDKQQVADGGGDNGGDGGGQPPPDSATKYKIAAPQTLSGMKLVKDDSPSPMSAEDQQKVGISNAQEMEAAYSTSGTATPEEGGKLAQFAGAWGEVSNPSTTVDKMFEAMLEEAGPDAAAQVPDPQRVTPAGMDGATVKCLSTPVSMCVWADNSTLGMLAIKVNQGGKPAPASLSETTNVLSELYKSARQPA